MGTESGSGGGIRSDKAQIILSVICGVVGSVMFLVPMGSSSGDAALTVFTLVMAFISVIRWNLRGEEPEYEET